MVLRETQEDAFLCAAYSDKNLVMLIPFHDMEEMVVYSPDDSCVRTTSDTITHTYEGSHLYLAMTNTSVSMMTTGADGKEKAPP